MMFCFSYVSNVTVPLKCCMKRELFISLSLKDRGTGQNNAGLC